MGIWQRVLGFLGLRKREDTDTASSTAACARGPRYGNVVSYLYPGSEATSVAAVYRCIQVLSDSVASLDLHYLRRDNEGLLVDDTRSDLHYCLAVQPQPELSIKAFWKQAMVHILLTGNAYIVPQVDDDGTVYGLTLCRPECVSHNELDNTYYICDDWNGVCGTFREPQLIHLYMYSRDGRNGESVLAHARRTIGIARAGDDETGNRFVNGGTVRGIVGNDKSGGVGFGEYEDAELEKAAENLDDLFQSGTRIASIPGQVEFKQISLSSTDMQFLETRKFTVLEVCRFFGVPATYVFADSSGNYKSVEMADLAFLRMTLNPYLEMIEAEFRRKLIPRSLYRKRDFRFDREGIFSLDLNSRADYMRKTIETGIYTVNEWRRKENLPAVEGGDVTMITANVRPLVEVPEPVMDNENL